MTTWAFTARDGAGRLLKGERPAGNETELRRALRDEGAYLVKARPRTGAAGARRLRRVDRGELTLFTFHLRNVVDAGVPLLGGLEDLRAETRDPAFRAILGEVLDGVTGGETLAQALAHHPAAFDALYVNMIDAGEQAGRLPHVLGRLQELLEWREEIRRRVRELVAYPIVVGIAMAGLVAVVLGFVFPRFAGIFERIDMALPLPTRVMIASSGFVRDWWLGLIGLAAVLWTATFLLLRIPAVRLFVDSVALRLPILGELVRTLAFGQVARSLATFLDSGIAIPHALRMVGRAVSNRRVAVSVEGARESILAGATLGEAFGRSGIFPPLVRRMVRMGEQSGRLVDALEKAGSIYDRELPALTKRLLGLVNPTLTLVLGGLLMFVVLAVMMPLYGMYQRIGTGY